MAKTRATSVANVSVEMERDKETKNTVRYRAPGDEPAIAMIYLPKPAYEQLGEPEKITLTVTPA